MIDEFKLYDKVEGIAGKLVMEHRKLFKNVCANVDFYSGFVYSMLGIPEELFPLQEPVQNVSGSLLADRRVYKLHVPYHRSDLHDQMLLYSVFSADMP